MLVVIMDKGGKADLHAGRSIGQHGLLLPFAVLAHTVQKSSIMKRFIKPDFGPLIANGNFAPQISQMSS